MVIQFIKNSSFLRKLIYNLGMARAWEMFGKIESFLKTGEKVLDVGAGIGVMTQVLVKKGYRVTPLDIKNLSFIDTVVPIIYDGKNFPFKDKQFDSCIILDTLHHTSDPRLILEEAKRVVKDRIIVMENIHNGPFHKFMTILADRAINFDYGKLNHKTDAEWKEIFKSLNLKIIGEHTSKFWLFFISKVYCLKKYEV